MFRKKNYVILLITIFGIINIPIFSEEHLNSFEYIHKESESYKARFIRFVISMIGIKTKIEKDITSGEIDQSPKKIPSNLKQNYEYEESEIEGRKIWSFQQKENKTGKTILFLHGGGYIYNILDEHWDFIEKLLKQSKANVVIPDYPLAPKFKAVDSMYFMDRLYKNILTKSDDSKVIFMGDSAGAGLALGFALQLKKEKKSLPSHIILISPWLDVTMSNPDLLSVDENDKILGIRGLQLAGKVYAGDLDTKDFRVSPIYGELKGLAKISIFISTYDMFIVECRKFKELLKNEKVAFNYFEYPMLFHDWIIFTGLSESEHALSEIVKLVDKD